MNILTLNYHEVTKDPRVFKQARALLNDGHDVYAMCRQMPGNDKHETVEGIRITRFDCFSPFNLSPSDIRRFWFLDQSLEMVKERFVPYFKEATKLRTYQEIKEWCDHGFESKTADLEAFKTKEISDEVATLAASMKLVGAYMDALRVLNQKITSTRAVMELANTQEDESAVLAAKAELTKLSDNRAAIRVMHTDETAAIAAAEDQHPEMFLAAKQAATTTAELTRAAHSARDSRSWLYAAFNQQRQKLYPHTQNLYQSTSLVFAINLLAEELPCIPDVIHAHDFYTLPGALVLARETGAKVLYDAHEYEAGRASKMPPEGNRLVDLMELDCLRYVDFMTTVSPKLGELYAERFPGEVPGIILNAPRLDMLGSEKAARSTIRSAVGIGRDVPLIVYTGGVQREKRGVDKAVAALVFEPSFHLAVLGPRHPGDDEWLLEHARAAGVEDRVTLLEPVEAELVVPMLQGADVAVLPAQDGGISYRYSLPNKLFESAFAGLPIAVANLPEMRNFVETLGIGIAMDSTSPAKIAEALRHLYDNRNDYIVSEKGRKRLMDDYSWTAQERKLCKIVERLGSPMAV